MTKYICKCGRVVAKNTTADNTGNRDTAGCEGCPYLLPWGPTEWTGVCFVRNIKGYECRMSPEISYATDYSGSADDKCTLKIHSLDLAFLDEVQAWIDECADEQLSGRFSRNSIRGTDYCNKGRYSWSISCAQNRKGMAAKAALIEHFFGPDKHRLDMTPQQEKAHILAAIEAGKARAQKKEDKALTYKDPITGCLYRVSPNPVNGEDVYGIEYLDSQNSHIWKPDVKWNTGAVYHDRDHLQEALEARARRDNWVPVEDAPGENPTDAAEDAQPCAPTASDVPPSQSQSVDADAQPDGGDDSGCLASNVGELIKAGSDDRRRVQSRANVECGKISVLHVCPQKPENRKIWLNAMMPAEYWVMNKPGDPCGEHIEICPYCNADLKNGEGDVLIVPFGQSANFTDAAPASPADAGAATQSLSAANPASLEAESAQLAFDYSGLDKKTAATLHAAERLIFEARRDYVTGLAQAVHIAHEALCGGVVQNLDNSKHGNRGDDAFASWCASVGLKRSTAYNLLQVNALLSGATPEEQATLEAASPSLLYAAAKPSAPAELVQAVKDGDITTHKQYQEAMEKLKAERESTSALLADEQRRRQEADTARIAAEKDAARYKEIKDAALETAKQQRERAKKAEQRAREADAAAEEAIAQKDALLKEKWEIAAELQKKEKQLAEMSTEQPVVAEVVDQETIENRAEILAKRQLCASLKEDVEATLSAAEGLVLSLIKRLTAAEMEDSVIAVKMALTSIKRAKNDANSMLRCEEDTNL